jgi:rare lipoprotein A
MIVLLAACSVAPERRASYDKGGAYYQDDGPPADKGPDPRTVLDAVPQEEPRSSIGNSPYTVFGKRYYPLQSSRGYREVGEASWYGKKFHGRKTSSGEVYDMYGMTAAHKTLPLPTYVQVRRLDTGKIAVVRVNDRGPFLGGRIIDLSYVAARKLDLISSGTAIVEVVALETSRLKHSTSVAGIYLQAGSFRLPGNAETLLRRLLKEELGPANIVTVEVSGVLYYQVQLGPITRDQPLARYISRVRAMTGRAPRKITN